MSNGYRSLFWGLLFILLDIRIEVLDLLPDFIGYIFIANGLSQLSSNEGMFRKAQPFAILLIFLALPNTIGIADTSIGENVVDLGVMLYQFVITIVHLFMMYYIFDATYRYAIHLEDVEWANSAKSIWKNYSVIHLIILMINAFLLNFDILQPILIVMVIIALIIEVVVLVFMKRSRGYCEEVEASILK